MGVGDEDGDDLVELRVVFVVPKRLRLSFWSGSGLNGTGLQDISPLVELKRGGAPILLIDSDRKEKKVNNTHFGE